LLHLRNDRTGVCDVTFDSRGDGAFRVTVCVAIGVSLSAAFDKDMSLRYLLSTAFGTQHSRNDIP